MDTPQYGETLKFVYTNHQPILVIELVILKKGNIQIAGGGSRTPSASFTSRRENHYTTSELAGWC